MEISKCPYCQHGNAADAKYCSECGGCLYLVPCPSCGAVNDIKAGSCYQCRQQLRAGTTGEALDHPAPVAVITKAHGPDLLSRALEVGTLETPYPVSPAEEIAAPPARRRAPVIVGTAVIAVMAGLGYYGYRHHAFFNGASAPAVGGSPASAGFIRQDAAAVDTASSKTGVTANKGDATPAPAKQTQTGRPSAASPAAPAVTAGSAADAAKSSAAAAAVNVRPDAREPAKTGGTASPPRESCQEAAAALGLCVPATTAATVPAVPAAAPVTHTRRSE